MKIHSRYVMALLAEAEARNALMEAILTAEERLGRIAANAGHEQHQSLFSIEPRDAIPQ